MKSIYCPGPQSRRSFLQAGFLGLGGMALGDLLRHRATAADSTPTKDDRPAVILIWLQGGPSHLETYDMKPMAPSDYRGEYNPIPTNVPGLDICEKLPLHAKVAERRLKSIEDGELDNPNLPYRFELPPGQMIVAAGAQGSPRTIPREGADDPRYQDFRREQRLREQGLLGPEDPDAGGPGGPVGPVLPEGPAPEAPAPESTTDDPGADEPPVDPDDDGGR